MKTSFYFVLWILIYPILGLFHNSFIDEHSFLVALALVWGLSWLLNRMMPATLTYESVSQMAPILEDVYTGNVYSFRKRLKRAAGIELVTAIYFSVSTLVIALTIFQIGMSDLITLVIFGIFTYGSISRCISLYKAKSRLNEEPTPEQCAEIADDTYRLDYAAYYDARKDTTYEDMFPPQPRFYKVFRIVSIVFAAIAALLGLIFIFLGAIILLSPASLEAGAVAGMYLLYGSLAAYFGVKDIISCFPAKTKTVTENVVRQA